MTIQGVYRFYQNGELVGESKNVLTTEGKRLILRVLAEQASSLGQAIGVGVGATAAVIGDKRLQWEVDRSAVAIRSADFDNSRVIMKTTLPQNAVYKIYEVGLWSQFVNSINSETAARTISTFETDIENWTNVTVDSTQARTSKDSLRIDAAISSTKIASADTLMDLSGYSGADQFNIAFYKANNNINTLALAFDSASGTFRRTLTVSALPVGYNVLTMNKGDFTSTGTPSWSAITKINVEVAAGATAGFLIMDGIRIEDADSVNPEYALISRSVLSSPLTKTDTAPMDIEYALEFNIT
jgi:hypothetical protein